jgi:hypothetical protein
MENIYYAALAGVAEWDDEMPRHFTRDIEELTIVRRDFLLAVGVCITLTVGSLACATYAVWLAVLA